MAFMSRLSRSRSNSRSPSRKDSEKGSPVLTVAELERLLYTGKTACNHADEVWPRLYIGDQNGSCALCRWAEQICYIGSRLPHDSPEHDFSRGHKDCEGPPWRHAKPRFPTAAQRSGQHTAHQPQCNIKQCVL